MFLPAARPERPEYQPLPAQPQPLPQGFGWQGSGPPPAGMPPQQGGFPPPQRRGMPMWLRITLVVVGVLIAVGGALFLLIPSQAAMAEPGDCLHVEEFAKRADEPSTVDCGDAKANVKVGAKVKNGEKCPDGDYDWIEFERGARLCLMLNVEQGDCVANVSSNTKGYQIVSCDDPAADIEILKVVEGTTDKEYECGGPYVLDGVTYSQPARTLCLGKPKSA